MKNVFHDIFLQKIFHSNVLISINPIIKDMNASSENIIDFWEAHYRIEYNETHSSLSPSFDFPPFITFSSFRAFAKSLHSSSLYTCLATSSSSITLIGTTESSPLIWRFLYSGSIHQMESTFIFIMVISIVGGRTKCRSIFVYKYNKIYFNLIFCMLVIFVIWLDLF